VSTSRQGNGGAAAATIPVENPATGELLTTDPALGEDDVASMARRARGAQPPWAALGFEGRARVLRRAQKWMLDNTDRILDCVVSETGKAYEDAQLTDFGYTVSALGFWAKEAKRNLADERIPSWNNPLAAGKKLLIRYEPVGVVGVIGPWNFPITNSFGDCVPALAAGNSVILKPSEVTPLSSLLMEEMMLECGLPEGVFQVATGDGSTGAALIANVDCIMFTGSTRTGKAVMKAAADALIPCYLELGGKDPMIVCADANIDRAANAATYYSMNNGGQVCISVERVYVEGPSTTSLSARSPRTSASCARERRSVSARSTSERSSSRRSSRSSTRTCATLSRRAPACSPAATPARAQAASTSPRCSSTWTTR
jgi:acyl-CoA reductase-like NAD-dependent aldehyde dehydrogenase